MRRFTRWARSAGLALILTAVPIAAAIPAVAAEPAGHVYVQTNAATGNEVVAFLRDSDGGLTYDETVATGGLGISAGLGSQASIAITDDERYLLAVNAGSDDVSLLEIDDDGLELADVHGVDDRPVSVAIHGRLVYVLNQGADTIQALRIAKDTLVDVPKSRLPLSTTGADGAQVAFSPDGRLLAVTEKATQTIDTYVVRPNGRAIGPKPQPSSGATPFGFQTDSGVDPRWFQDADGRAPGAWRTHPNDWSVIPEDRLLGNETLSRIEQAISSLPPMQAEVIRLRDVQGWSAEEVRDLLDLSDTNQRVLLHRARSRVRRELDEYLSNGSEGA